MNTQNYLKRLQKDLKNLLDEVEEVENEELKYRVESIVRDCIERTQNELWRLQYGL